MRGSASSPTDGEPVLVLVLCNDLSGNAAGRAWNLVKAIEPFATPELWGPASRGRLWEPLEGAGLKTRMLESGRFPGYARSWRRLAEDARGFDAIYSVKPLYASYGMGRRAAAELGIRHVLDVDDWELGFLTTGGVMWKVRAEGLLRWRDPHAYFPTAHLDRLARRERHVTVSNAFLQERFGGALVPHGRSLNEFNPDRFDGDAVKERFGLAGKRVVLFFGTPRPHKGVDVLVDALPRLPGDAVLAIVGAGEHDAYAAKLRSLAAREPRLRVFGQVPIERAPEVLAMADVVAIPQLEEAGTVGQIPAKLGDALAMARPVVATRVGDIPRVSEGAAVLVPPGDAAALGDALTCLLDDPKRREELGARARKRAAEALSLDVMTERLRNVFGA